MRITLEDDSMYGINVIETGSVQLKGQRNLGAVVAKRARDKVGDEESVVEKSSSSKCCR